MATPERIAALKLLEEAILALRATAPADDDMAEVMTAYIGLASFTRYDAEGGATAVCVYMPETMPNWQQQGLLRAGLLMIEADFLEIPTDPS